MENETFLLDASLMIKMVLYALSKEELTPVRHFLKDDYYEMFNQKLALMKSRKEKYTFKDLNTKCAINREFDTEEGHCIEVLCTCMGIYYLESPFQKISEEEKNNTRNFTIKVLFEKKKEAEKTNKVICLGCGNPLNILENSTCPQCGRVYDLANFNYVIKEMDI